MALVCVDTRASQQVPNCLALPPQTHGGAKLVGAWLRLDYRSGSRAGYKTNKTN